MARSHFLLATITLKIQSWNPQNKNMTNWKYELHSDIVRASCSSMLYTPFHFDLTTSIPGYSGPRHRPILIPDPVWFQTHSNFQTHSRSMLYWLSIAYNNTLIICSIQLNCFACVSSRYQAIFPSGLGMRLVVRLSSQLIVLLQHTGWSSSSVSSNWKTNKRELWQPNTSSRLGWNFRSGFLFEFYLAFFLVHQIKNPDKM